ncbi:hypothetical protein FOCG_14911 [Fusarium oxysporum f. sp. radicis-lycopersici 26381]|nr:hypothetical protein FOCG_14911 [Fusarium oxysporum f. sp. radicis-lycopersici 26381]
MVLSKQTTEERLCSRCESLDLDNIPSGRWTNVECREPVAFFGKRSAVLHDEGCPLCQAPFYIAAGEHNTWSSRREDKFCMFTIPSQLAYRGAKLEFTSDGEMGDRVLGRAKDQRDSTWLIECPEKREQIQKMHKIYREADLTIIAAAGDGPDYGLPGISTPRVSAPSVDLRLGAHRLVSTGRSAQEAVRNTRWASRAWTFQEGLVSRRKLVFTVWSVSSARQLNRTSIF